MRKQTRKQEVNGYVTKWQQLWLLDQWDVFVEIQSSNKLGSEGTQADIATIGRYIEASMTVYPYLWESADGHDAEYREATIAHELAHIVISPLEVLIERMMDGHSVTKAQYLDALERVTEHVTRAMVRANQKKKR